MVRAAFRDPRAVVFREHRRSEAGTRLASAMATGEHAGMRDASPVAAFELSPDAGNDVLDDTEDTLVLDGTSLDLPKPPITIEPHPAVRSVVDFLQQGKWDALDACEWGFVDKQGSAIAEGRTPEGMTIRVSVEQGRKLHLDLSGVQQRYSLSVFDLMAQGKEVQALQTIQQYMRGW